VPASSLSVVTTSGPRFTVPRTRTPTSAAGRMPAAVSTSSTTVVASSSPRLSTPSGITGIAEFEILDSSFLPRDQWSFVVNYYWIGLTHCGTY